MLILLPLVFGALASEDLSKIFEELYRGSNARSTEGSG